MTAPGRRWAFEDHTGDIAVVVEAEDAPALFEVAAQALFGVILDDPSSVVPRETVPFKVEGAADLEDLLVRFLSELLFLHDARNWVFRDARVIALAAGSLDGEARGEKLDPARHAVSRQLKAVTYHGLSIVHRHGGLSARVVFDL